MSFEAEEAENILSGSAEAVKRRGAMLATGDIVYVYADPPLNAVVGEFLAGLPEFTPDYEYQLIPVLWPRRYGEPVKARVKGLGGPSGYMEAPDRLVGALEKHRCASLPRVSAVLYGVQECIYCRSTLALLRDVFGYSCVEECDISGEECFDRYEELVERLFPGSQGVPLSLGRYGGSAWAAYGGLNVYDMEKVYRLLSPGTLVAYSGGAGRRYPLSALENSSSKTL